jgi:hypothetical protein
MRHVRHVPALVIATVALVIAATGTALGGPAITTATVTPAQAKKIAAAEVKRLAPSLSVKSARTANTANTATTATTANAPATYAQTTPAGGVAGTAQGVTQANVIHPRAGIYCFTGLASQPKGGVGVLDANPPTGFSNVNLIQVGAGTISLCPAGTQAVVATFSPTTGFADEPFLVTLWF